MTPSTDSDLVEAEADADDYWESEYVEITKANDQRMGVDAMGNAIEKDMEKCPWILRRARNDDESPQNMVTLIEARASSTNEPGGRSPVL